MKQYIVLGVGCLVTLSLGLPLYAATFKTAQNYEVRPQEVVEDNLYAAAETLSIGGNIEGDLIAAGRNVLISGSVEEDAMLAGQQVDIHAVINGDVRAAGQQISIDKSVKGDTILAGSVVYILPQATVSGDTVIMAERVVIEGVLEKNAKIRAQIVEINGIIKGNVDASVGQSLAVTDTATIEGALAYTAPSEALISEQSTIQGGVTFTHQKDKPGMVKVGLAILSVLALLKLVTVLVSSLLLVTLFPRFAKRVVSYALTESARSTILGLFTWVLMPVLGVLLLVTVLGFHAGLLLLAGFLLLILLAKALAGVMAGAMLSQLITKNSTVSWEWTVLGVFALFIIGLVPILGWIANVIVYFAVSGSIVQGIYVYWWQRRKESDVVSV